jgi:hypothetical protein
MSLAMSPLLPFRGKKQSSSDEKESVTVSFVTLAEPRLEETDALFAHYRGRWPGLPQAQDIQRDGDILHFNLGSSKGIIILVPLPIPWSELVDSCRLAFWWEDAEQVMRAHQAHVVVSLIDDSMQPVGRVQMLTRLIDSVAQSSGATGIVWGAGGVLSPPKWFCDAACSLDMEPFPVPIWVSFRPEVHGDQTTSLSTLGLSDLGHWEVEVHCARAKPAAVFERVGDFAMYLVQRGHVVKDGDTFGYTAEERIRVHYRMRGKWTSGPVYELEFPDTIS